jgi:glutathione S-transferase
MTETDEAPMMTLWHAIECPLSMRVRLVLAEKAQPYASREVSLDDVGDEVRERSPRGEVPVLEADGCSIYDAQIIAEYLEERHPESPLWPTDPSDRARARMLIDWIDAQLLPPVKVLEQAHAERGVVGEPSRDGKLQDALSKVKAGFHTLGTMIHADGFVLGGFGIVDVFLAPLVVGAQHIGIRRDEIPAAAAQWLDRLRDRPTVSAEAQRRLHAIGLVEEGPA